MVLVVDESGSMNREHEWLLIMIPLLEQVLVQAGESPPIKISSRNLLFSLIQGWVLVRGTDTVWWGLEASESTRQAIL